jgi:hypothetical protein
MGENNLTLIIGDDWEGIYHDGLLIYEGHEVQRRELVNLMKSHETFNVEFKALNDMGIDWLHEEGSLPEYISGIPYQCIEQ